MYKAYITVMPSKQENCMPPIQQMGPYCPPLYIKVLGGYNVVMLMFAKVPDLEHLRNTKSNVCLACKYARVYVLELNKTVYKYRSSPSIVLSAIYLQW